MLKCCWRSESKPPGLNSDYAYSVWLKHFHPAAHSIRLNRRLRGLMNETETVTGEVWLVLV